MSTPAKPIKIYASERDDTLNPRQLRKAGFIPTTVYGKEAEPRNIQVKAKEFSTHYGRGMRIFELEGLNLTARAHQLQIDPVTQQVLSLQLLAIDPEDVKKALAAEAARREEEAAALERAKEEALANQKAAEAAAAAAAAAEAGEEAPADGGGEGGGEGAPAEEGGGEAPSAEKEEAPATA